MSVSNVNDLIDKPFRCFTKDEQVQIVRQGRFTDLRNLCQNDKGKYRMFVVNWYKKVHWLTGNTVNRKLYCWNCLLFPSGTSKIWNSTGFDDLKNLSQSIKKHEETKEHTYSTVKLKLLLKRRRTEIPAKEQEFKNDVKVRRNRKYLERLIDVASVLAHFEVPFRSGGDDGFYRNFLNIFKKYDDIVRTQIEEDTSFKGLTKTTQTDLIKSIAHAVKQKIVDEVNAANFFSLQLDEVICSKLCRQVAISVRYVKEARPVERFLGLYEIGVQRKAEELVGVLETELSQLSFQEKMISQSYDGGVVKYTELYNLQQAVKRLQGRQTRCPLVPSYAHDLSAVLSQSLRSIQECKLFFSMIKLFSTFFNNIALIDVLPDVSSTWTESVHECIETIYKNHLALVQVLEFINTAEEYVNSPEIISQAVNLINHLKSFKFMLFVHMFQKVFSMIKGTFENISAGKNMKNYYSTVYHRKKINNLIERLKILKSEASFKILLAGVPSFTTQQIIVTGMLDLQQQIVDHIVYEIDGRFLDVELQEWWRLLSFEEIPNVPYSLVVPDNAALEIFKEHYGYYFDVVKLKSDLDLLYSDPGIAGIGESGITKASDMLKFMFDHEINNCLPMLNKLLELVVTVPSVTEPLEGSDCVLKRIREYCNKEKNEEPRSALAFLVIEKELFGEMEKSPHWYKSVIDHFATLPSTSSIELTYKTVENGDAEPCGNITEPELTIKSDPEPV